jgi:CRP-like cAMP-binding protein
MKGDANDFLRRLRAVPLLQDLPEVRLAGLAATARARRFAKGELVFQKGDCPNSLIVVASGSIKVACQSPEGGEKVLEVLGSGETLGEASLVLGVPYPFFAAALSDAQILFIDGKPLLDLIAGSTPFAKRLLSHLSERLHTIVRDIESFSIHSPTQRVVGFLIEEAGVLARPAHTVTLPAPKHVFASRLGMTPEAFSRALRDLTDSGLIQVVRNRIVILDRERLGSFMV